MTRQMHHWRAGLAAALPAGWTITGLAMRGAGCAATAVIVVLSCSLPAAHADAAPPAPTEVAVTPTGHVTWVDAPTSAEVPVTGHRIVEKQESNDAAVLVDTTVSVDSFDLPQTDGYEHLVCVSALSGAAEGSATCVTHQSYVTPDQITITGTGYMRHGEFILAASGVNSFGGPGATTSRPSMASRWTCRCGQTCSETTDSTSSTSPSAFTTSPCRWPTTCTRRHPSRSGLTCNLPSSCLGASLM